MRLELATGHPLVLVLRESRAELPPVCRVLGTVDSEDIWNVQWIYTLKTTYVEPILLRIGSTLVMSVDAAD